MARIIHRDTKQETWEVKYTNPKQTCETLIVLHVLLFRDSGDVTQIKTNKIVK